MASTETDRNIGSRNGQPARTVIFGGCVSRDAVEFADDNTYDLLRYIARHSLLSAGSDATANLPAFRLDSNFQQRMLEFDVRGRLLETLNQQEDVDLFIWDLNVERSGVVEFPDGSLVTNSYELRSVADIKTALKRGRHIKFGSFEHRARWMGAASMFVAAAQEIGMRDKMIVLSADWAEHDSQGRPTGRLGGKSAREHNRLFSHYYRHLENLGLPVQRFKDVVADPEHKWGRGPFHYTSKTYRDINRKIGQFLASGGRER